MKRRVAFDFGVFVLVVGGAAASLVLAVSLEEWFHPSAMQEGQWLLLTSLTLGLAIALLAGRLAKAQGRNAGSVMLTAGLLTFLLAWLPLVTLSIVDPPT